MPGGFTGLLGANGAGKSTLINIQSASYPATRGKISWKGQVVQFGTPLAATKAGIATIHQNIPLIPAMSVLENVFLWKEGGWRQNEGDRSAFASICDEVGYNIDPDLLASDLSIGERQMVCVLQALSHNADLIVMDEPTASLAKKEREVVYATVRNLAAIGKGVIFVSHFLDEIMALTDEVSVLRDGAVVLTAETNHIGESAIAEAIAGRSLEALEHQRADQTTIRSEVLLECRDLASPEGLLPTNLTLRAGEVIGIAGLLGSGRSELVQAIFGADPHATGDVLFQGTKMPRSPRAAVRAGMALVPEDRDQQAIIPVFEIWRNISLPYLDQTADRGIFVNKETEMAWADKAIDLLSIKTQSPETLVTELSGGNAQKVTVARWLFGGMKLFILDEATAGIDVGAKADILALVNKLASEGVAVIFISSEFEEILAVSHRVLVMREGAIVAARESNATTNQELILLTSSKSALAE